MPLTVRRQKSVRRTSTICDVNRNHAGRCCCNCGTAIPTDRPSPLGFGSSAQSEFAVPYRHSYTVRRRDFVGIGDCYQSHAPLFTAGKKAFSGELLNPKHSTKGECCGSRDSTFRCGNISKMLLTTLSKGFSKTIKAVHVGVDGNVFQV